MIIFICFQFGELRAKWSVVLKKIINPNDHVCENHFKDNEICKYDEIVLPDGSIIISPRTRYTLKPNAIPFLFNNEVFFIQ